MKWSYELTLQEFKLAFRLHSRQKLGRRIHWFIYDFVFPGITVLFLAFTAYLWMTGSEAMDDFIIYDIALVTMVVLIFTLRAFRIRSAFRALFPPGAKNRITSITFSDEEILTSVEGVGEGRYLWAGVSAFVENQAVALFYIGDERFLILPRRVLNPPEHADLAALVARHVETRKTC
jgi:hypothetical protein